MATAIRLARAGAKKRPYYHIVVADSRRSRDGRYIEKIGTYNPMLAKDDEKRVVINADRITHWLGEGAQPSDRVTRFLEAAGLVKGKATRNNPNKGKPGQKALDRVEEKAQKVVDAKEAAATAATEAKEAAATAATEAKEAAATAATEAKEAAAAAAAPAEEAAAEEAPAAETPAEEAPAEVVAEAPAEAKE